MGVMQAGAADVWVPDATVGGLMASQVGLYLRFSCIDAAFNVELDEHDWRQLASMRRAAAR